MIYFGRQGNKIIFFDIFGVWHFWKSVCSEYEQELDVNIEMDQICLKKRKCFYDELYSDLEENSHIINIVKIVQWSRGNEFLGYQEDLAIKNEIFADILKSWRTKGKRIFCQRQEWNMSVSFEIYLFKRFFCVRSPQLVVLLVVWINMKNIKRKWR